MVALNDNDGEVRAAAVDSLGALGGKDAAPGLMSALSDSDEKVRRRAAEAVGKTGDPKVVVPLIALFSDSVRQVRDQAVKAVADMGDVAGEALIRGLMEEDPTVREHCARALSFVTVSDALEPLLKVLEDGDWSVRRYAAEALGKLGDRKAIAYLLGAMNDPIDFVRERARQALDRIDPSGVLRKREKPVKLRQAVRPERPREEEPIREAVTPEAATMELPVAYDVLGLDLGATRKQVRRAWQELMRKYHPDVVMDLPENERLRAEEEAKRVNVAYQVLIKAIPE
jgi:HEAT repeat protein